MSKKRTSDRTPLVVVANRLPVKRSRRQGEEVWSVSPGGLVSALTPILQETTGAWVGWPGIPGENVEPFTHSGMRLRPVPISRKELQDYYEGFSNRTLWPLFHDAIRAPEFRRRWWWPYIEINRRFAEATAEVVAEGGSVWVQDYQLTLVPSMLRALRPDVRIGFFLHIPFPAQELFARLPWRSEILKGLLGADVVGFQTKLGARNFARTAKRFTEARGPERHLEFEGRTVLAQAFPISIDFERFESLARSEDVQARCRRLRESIGPDRKIMLGVDRLDYTKGIDVRLRAIEELFKNKEFSASDAVFIQVAVPSREGVAEYKEMRSRIEELVGRINGQYTEPGLVPIHYLRRSLAQDELVAYYLAADLLICSPLRDGMNLVAKEYAASRIHDDGVIVLSEFTGAAHEMKQALIINPFDIDGVTATLQNGLRLQENDVKRRMRSMRRQIRTHDVYAWANGFLDAVRS